MVALTLNIMQARTLGDRLRSARNNREMTQDQLATRCGVSRSLISQWETGTVQEISASHLYAAAKALRVSLDWLLEGDGEPAVNETASLYGEAAELVELWASLTATQRADLLEDIRARAEHNRALIQELIKGR